MKPDKEQIGRDNQTKIAELDKILFTLEKHIPASGIKGYRLSSDEANTIGNLIITMNDTIYNGAIKSFCESVYDCCYKYDLLSEDDFSKIRYIYDKWNAITTNQKIDEQLFEDFKNDLEEFTVANPNYSDDGLTFVWFFEEKIWNPYFKESANKAKELCNKLQNILDSKEGRIDFLIQSGFASISPFEFEELIGKLFTKMGYNTDLTPKTCDYGIDIIAKNDRDIIAIQTKKYSKGNNVGNRDVQRLLGAMQLSTIKASKAILITTSDFTVQAIEQAKETPIELWDGNYISELFRKYDI
jgi:hypothetical protein